MSTEKINILVTDDNPAKLEQIAAILEDDEINIVRASSGEEAIRKANSFSFALIIMDIKMPGIDGFETASLIRKNTINASTPIIFITGTYFSNQDVFKGYQVGAVDYLTAPVNPVILKSKVNIFIELYLKSRKLEQLLVNQEQFYSIVAHDLRSPFNPLLGFFEILSIDFDELSREEIQGMILIMSESANNLFALLNDLLELARIKADDFVFTLQRVLITNVVDKVFNLYKKNAEKKSIVLINQVDRNKFLFADESMLGTVIRNLVSNAIKFTPEQGTITISFSETEDEQKIDINDTGMGIPKENLDKLFRKDVKYTTQGTDGEAGTGLGLSICAELMKKQSGSVTVESEIGKGTTFVLSLPKNYK